MHRRTFVALTFSTVAFTGMRNSLASSEFPEPKSNPVEPAERFPISRQDYKKIKARFLPRIVHFPTRELPGTIVIDPERRFLFLVLGSGQAKRYGIGVGREGFAWSGTATIGRKAKWPSWFPPKAMMARDPEAAKWPNGMPGGPSNPLGARALYLYQGEVDTLFRIHGTREPKSIGQAVSSGCIRMLNADVAELFARVPVGAKVIVLGSSRPVAQLQRGLTKAFRAEYKARRAPRRSKRSIFDWLRRENG